MRPDPRLERPPRPRINQTPKGWGPIQSYWPEAGGPPVIQVQSQTSSEPDYTGAPSEANPFLFAGERPPEPGTAAFDELGIPTEERRLYYSQWWYAHYTSDAPAAEPEPTEPRRRRPGAPRSRPTTGMGPEPETTPEPATTTPMEPVEGFVEPEAPAGEPPAETPPEGEQEPPEGELATVTGQPTGPEGAKRTPWGWIVGIGTAVLAVGAGVAYALSTRKRGRRRG